MLSQLSRDKTWLFYSYMPSERTRAVVAEGNSEELRSEGGGF